MSRALVAFIVILALAESAVSQTSRRTADGQPDIQGVWSNASIIPLERPKELEGKQTEMAGWEGAAAAKTSITNCQKRFGQARGKAAMS